MITIKRAYADLENEGYIITRSGLGSYVANISKQTLREEKLIEILKSPSKGDMALPLVLHCVASYCR